MLVGGKKEKQKRDKERGDEKKRGEERRKIRVRER